MSFRMARRQEIERLQSEVEELFADLWQLPHFLGARGFRPQVDCYRSTKHSQFVVFVELAGVDPSKLTEIEDGPFERRIPLEPDVDVADGRARYRRGLLSIVFALAKAPARPEQV